MAYEKILGLSDHQAICKASSGGIRFKMRSEGDSPELIMIALHEPNICLYKLTFGYETEVYSMGENQTEKFPSKAISNFNEFREYYLTWHNNKIKFGIVGQEALVDYQKVITDPILGYIQFKTKCNSSHSVEWFIETSPVLLKSIPFKKLSGKLHWRKMRDGKLPLNAMIGGFDNELIYIARAKHFSSLCPGKYVPSTGKAFVPWGKKEYAKEKFEILCGINGTWVKTGTNYVLQNALIGGYTEVNNEPLYIGRAMIEGRLICGKVNLLYDVCYVPFQGREIEQPTYDILVTPGNEIPQAIPF